MFCPNCGDKVQENEIYCSNCGCYLVRKKEPVNVNIQPKIKKRNSKIKSFATGIAISAVALITIGSIYMSIAGSNIYMPEESFDNSNNFWNKKEKPKVYQTIIVADNKYEGISIKNEYTAKKLIRDDSLKQKNKCPNEIRKIEDRIIKNHKITAVNLCEMDVNLAREIEKVFDKIYTNFPMIKGYLTNVTLINAKLSDGYIAAFQPVFTFATNKTKSTYPWVIKSQIYLNTAYFLNEKRLIATVNDGSSSGHFPPNTTPYSPVAHELGHYLSFIAMMKYYKVESILLIDNKNIDDLYSLLDNFKKGNFSYKLLKEAYNLYISETKANIDFDSWRSTISKYALAKDNSGKYIYDETIAEAFHDYYLNGNNARNASKYIIEILKRYLEV